MIAVRIMHGSAVTPYTVRARQSFHTEFAAALFGRLSCESGRFLYWAVDKLEAA